ncbi:SigE family RNA polymerase sigma factor [Kineosporia sp. R_H_3]|uniref:SigE family RNA polymerase sigma factor n=1 Tax=Kineosporia sp. R_H_3 TaxID=1961848 RepID=UPI0018E9AB2A|nr:SigE family RNA polymerase sigma factor [Kineosporia sp. R_H_3]
MTSDDVEHGFTAWAVTAWPRLLRTATALTAGDHHLAEDLVQTALAKTYVAWPRVHADASRGEHPDRYVHRVLVRVFVDETRRPWWRRERRRIPSAATGPGVLAGVPDRPDDSVSAPDDVLAVRDALGALPPDQRAAVVLRYWLGHDVRETAALLGCPEATVRSRSARGLARLRALLGPLDDSDLPTPKGAAR